MFSIKIVGNLNGSPFHIIADVKTVKIHVSRTYIYRRQKILERTVESIIITNETPTITRFTMKLVSKCLQSRLASLGLF